MRISALPVTGWIVLALAVALSAPPAAAQMADQIPNKVKDAATAFYASALATGETDPQLRGAIIPDESALLGNMLIFDPAQLASALPNKTLRLPSLTYRKDLDISRADRPDGSSTVALKKALPIDWDANVGADLAVGSAPPDGYQPQNPMPGSSDGSGAAWASVGVSKLATVDARVDPNNDQGKLGTTFKHSIPVGDRFSVTLQNSFSVTETFSGAQAELPPIAAPSVAATQSVPHIWGNEKLAKLDILPTGTTLSAGLASASNDPVTHNTLSADQKLYGPLHLTTAMIDVGQPTSGKSISAGFKLNW